MTAPTFEQLLILVNRAGDGLKPGEVKRLRDGLTAMAEQRIQAGATIAGLQSAVRTWRGKAETAQKELGAAQPYSVPCTRCGADIGQRCRATRGTVPPVTPHTARLYAASKQPEGRQP